MYVYAHCMIRVSSTRGHACADACALALQVEWQSKKLRDNNATLLKAHLSQLFNDDAGTQAYLDCVKEYEESVPPEEAIRVIWASMVGSINTVGKNQMQMLQMIVKMAKQNKPLLEAYTKSLKQELALLNCLQVTCYEDSKLLKARPCGHTLRSNESSIHAAHAHDVDGTCNYMRGEWTRCA